MVLCSSSPYWIVGVQPMDKQEAMQTHRLLMTVAQEAANRFDTGLSMSDLDQYQEVGVKPTDLHKKRADHEDAILALSGDLASTLSDTSEAEEKEPVEV